jgi:hypothetical protein
MENKFNLTSNLVQSGKKSLENSKRLENQANDFLKKYYDGLREEEQAKQAKLQETMIANAAFGASSVYMRNKQRAQLLEQQIRYNNRMATIVMADYLSNIVESALLVDTDEYSQLNPAYKADIRETVLSFLENADIEKSVKDKRLLTIMEHVAREIPDVKTGIYLKEEEIVDIVNRQTPEAVNQSIDSLTLDVKERVANLVSQEQAEVNDIEKQIEEIVAISEATKSKGQPAIPVAEVPAEEYVEEVPADAQYEEIPEDEYYEYQQPEISKPKETKIKISKEGQVEVTIKEAFIKETPRKGVLETLALNEGLDMVKEGKEYNGDLALANALMYITILETMNATGLLKLSKYDYQQLLK